MKSDVKVYDLFNEKEILGAMDAILKCEGNFISTMNALNLKKETDFRYSNLSGVDFSYSDLRGFNFTGADLRDCYGIDVVFDTSTNLSNANVTGSLFAKWVREDKLYSERPNAIKNYDILKNCGWSDNSKWLSYQFGSGPSAYRALKNIDDREASIQCQRLILDDIDLTKRTDLFFFLKKFCTDRQELRELILEVLARHVHNSSIVTSFIGVAGSIFRNDEVISKALMALCRDQRIEIQIAAFTSIALTPFFTANFNEVSDIFFSKDSLLARKQMIYSAALSLGVRHVRAINIDAKSESISLDVVLDYEELLSSSLVKKIALNSQIATTLPSQATNQNGKRVTNTFALHRKPMFTNEILELQAEVMVSARVISKFVRYLRPRMFKTAKERVEKRNVRLETKIRKQIRSSYYRGR